MSDENKVVRAASLIASAVGQPPGVKEFVNERLALSAARGTLLDFAGAQMQFNFELVNALVAIAGEDADAKKAALMRTLEMLENFQKEIQPVLTSMIMDEVYSAPVGKDQA